MQDNVIKRLRLERAWSQQQLADCSGISVRTIQRLEQGEKPGFETLKAIAATLNIDVARLQQLIEAQTMTDNAGTADTLQPQADTGYTAWRGFYKNLFFYIVIIAFLAAVNWLTARGGYWWVVWPALGWGLSILMQAIAIVFRFGWPEIGTAQNGKG